MSKRLYYNTISVLIITLLVLASTSMWIDNNRTIEIAPIHVEDVVPIEVIDASEFKALDHIEPPPDDQEVETVEPDEYDGEVIIATAREVITMQVVDGVKTFTNHLIG